MASVAELKTRERILTALLEAGDSSAASFNFLRTDHKLLTKYYPLLQTSSLGTFTTAVPLSTPTGSIANIRDISVR